MVDRSSGKQGGRAGGVGVQPGVPRTYPPALLTHRMLKNVSVRPEGAAITGVAAYEVDYSCRFNDDDSAKTSHTTGGTPTDASKGVFGTWFKRGNLGINAHLVSSVSERFDVRIDTSDRVYIVDDASSTLVSTLVLRDPTAWYQLVLSYDSDEGAAADRLKIWLNGVEITSWSSDSRTNITSGEAWGLTIDAEVKTVGNFSAQYFDGYLAQTFLIDGTSIQNGDHAITAFGEFDDNGVWRPVDVSGLTFGTNGWLLDYAVAPGTGNGAGTDVSGNANHFTDSGLAANDQVSDTPTTNWSTWNTLFKTNGTWNYANGNLDAIYTSSTDSGVFGSIGVSTGKWYFEFACSSTSINVGVVSETAVNSGDLAEVDPQSGGWDSIGGDAWVYARKYDGTSGIKINANSAVVYGDAYTTEVIGVALDLDNDIIWFSKSGTYQNSATIAEVQDGDDSNAAFSGEINGQIVFPFVYAQTNMTVTANFGQSDFAGTLPTGFNALNTANLATPAIPDGTAHFQTTLYTGNGSVRNIDQTGNSTFQPDLVWIKNRDTTDIHSIFDSNRGATKYHGGATAGNSTEVTNANSLTSFDSDGFGLGSGAGGWNDNTEKFVAWQWKAGGAGSSNEDGSINTTKTSVSTEAGISIIHFTGNGTAGATIGHGLGKKPEFIIQKAMATAEHAVAYLSYLGAHYGYYLGHTAAAYDLNIYWNDVEPTTSLITLAGGAQVNHSANEMISYAWVSVEGFSKFGSYTGNGAADGPFVYTGFKPAYVQLGRTNSTHTVQPFYDSDRSPYNEIDDQLTAHNTLTETTGSEEIDFLASGFKIRTNDADVNASGGVYRFAVWAEYPFGGDGLSPATAV